MNVKKLLLWGAIGALISMPGHAADSAKARIVDDNMIGLSTPNGKLAYEFIDLWFNKHKPEEAFAKYVAGDNYMNHSVNGASANKKRTFEQEVAEEVRITPPGAIFDIKQLVSQGSLVFAHILAKQNKAAVGDEMVMILRVRDGKIIDHWDIHVPLKADSVVFEGLAR